MPGGTSPKESWLRLLVLDAGLPKPFAQLMVHNGDHYPLAYLDLGWEEYMVAVEYDGDQHRKDRKQYLKDISRLRMLERMGWIVIRVVAEDHPSGRMRAAGAHMHSPSRGYRECDVIVGAVTIAAGGLGAAGSGQPLARAADRPRPSSIGASSPTTRDSRWSASCGLRARHGPCR